MGEITCQPTGGTQPQSGFRADLLRPSILPWQNFKGIRKPPSSFPKPSSLMARYWHLKFSPREI